MCVCVCVCVCEPPAHTQVALNDMEVSIENLSKLTKELQEECSKMTDILGEGAKLKLNVCCHTLAIRLALRRVEPHLLLNLNIA